MTICYGVDIGNSGLRVARFDARSCQIEEPFRIQWLPQTNSAPERTANKTEYFAGSPTSCIRKGASRRFSPGDRRWLTELERFLSQQAADSGSPSNASWWIASVRRDALDLLCEFLHDATNNRKHVVTFQDLPLAIRVDQPERVGIDRLLAAYAAATRCERRPVIVVQAGSAVTVDFVSGTSAGPIGVFDGGAILPGVPMMLRLLGQAADMLPELDADDLIELPDLPGKNTEQAMRCGAASALVGGLSHLIGRYRSEYGMETPVILSGGDGMRLSPYVAQPVMVEPHLVHHGLLLVAQRMMRSDAKKNRRITQ